MQLAQSADADSRPCPPSALRALRTLSLPPSPDTSQVCSPSREEEEEEEEAAAELVAGDGQLVCTAPGPEPQFAAVPNLLDGHPVLVRQQDSGKGAAAAAAAAAAAQQQTPLPPLATRSTDCGAAAQGAPLLSTAGLSGRKRLHAAEVPAAQASGTRMHPDPVPVQCEPELRGAAEEGLRLLPVRVAAGCQLLGGPAAEAARCADISPGLLAAGPAADAPGRLPVEKLGAAPPTYGRTGPCEQVSIAAGSGEEVAPHLHSDVDAVASVSVAGAQRRGEEEEEAAGLAAGPAATAAATERPHKRACTLPAPRGSVTPSAAVMAPPPSPPPPPPPAPPPPPPPLAAAAAAAAMTAGPAPSVAFLHGCVAVGGSRGWCGPSRLPPVQPGEVRLCGLTFHPALGPRVRAAMEDWLAALGDSLANADPASVQIQVPLPPAAPLPRPATGAGPGPAAAAGEEPSWCTAFREHRLSANVVCSRLARYLGLMAEDSEWDAPLPAEVLEPTPGVAVATVAEGPGAQGLFGSLGLVATAPLRRSAVLGIVGGYVMPAGVAARFASRGFRDCREELLSELRRRAAPADLAVAWQFVAGAFRMPYPGLELTPQGATGGWVDGVSVELHRGARDGIPGWAGDGNGMG
jgi:hypothetical protein